MVVADLPAELEAARRVLLEDDRVQLAIAFGSFVRGNHGPASDVDVAVDVGQPLDADARIDLTRKLAAATGRPIDLIDLCTVGVPLSRTILTEGVHIVRRDMQRYVSHVIRMHRDVEDVLPLRNRVLRDRLEAWTNR